MAMIGAEHKTDRETPMLGSGTLGVLTFQLCFGIRSTGIRRVGRKHGENTCSKLLSDYSDLFTSIG